MQDRPAATTQETATPRERMRSRLRDLYGDAAGDRAFADLTRLLDAFPRRERPSASPDIFDQSDAVLITYGDTFLPTPPSEGGGAGGARRSRPSAPSPSATSTASSPPSTSSPSSRTPRTTASP